METLEAKTRDLSVKGKKLRREGYATGSISGKAMKESLAIIMTQKDLGMSAPRQSFRSMVRSIPF